MFPGHQHSLHVTLLYGNRGGWEFFSSPPRPERLWGSTQPPIQWVPGAIPLGVKLTTHLHVVPRSICLHGVVLG
jgi:hypothetical protein